MVTITASRYPGSRPFQDNPLDRRVFFGRKQEEEKILHAILAEDLIVVFARSGIGKTSLLNAGVIHRLRRKNFLPIIIRFNDPSRSPQWIIYDTIKSAFDRNSLEYDERLGLSKNIARLEFSTGDAWSSETITLTPVLILDQFEEFFTLYTSIAREQFLPHFAGLITQRVHHLKIVVSIREDFLGYLQEIAYDVPGILQNRFRLSALTREQAKAAIIQPAALVDDTFSTAAFQYAPEAIEAMLNFLCKQNAPNAIDSTKEVEPFQLQVLCQHIESSLIKAEAPRHIIQEKDLGGETGMQNILKTFYRTQLHKIKPFWKRRRVRNFFEKGLINANNRRLSLEEDDIRRRFKIPKQLLAQFVNVRLLRAEPRKGGLYYELSHDNLIAPIQQSLQLSYRRQNVFLLCILVGLGLGFLGFYQKGGGYSAIGTGYYLTQNYTQAGKYYIKAIQRNPRRIDYYHKLGNALNKQGNYEEAMENFIIAITLDPDYLETKMKMAEIYLVSERFESSVTFAREVLQANTILPAGTLAQEDMLAMRFFIIASLFFQGEQVQAKEELQHFIQQYTSLSGDYTSDWNYAGSEKFIRNNVRISDTEQLILLQLIRVLEKNPEASKIMRELQKMIDAK